MIQITVRNNEPLEKALRRFKKKFEKAGILKDLKKNAHYMKPSTERRMKQAKARKRHARDARQPRR
ncbi:MAG: 30S ribosomal protein S21 [Fidelibacterota bacterium]